MELPQEVQEDYETIELTKRTYLQDTDFASQEFEFLFRHPPAVPPRPAKHQQSVGIPLISGERVAPNQLFRQDKEIDKQNGHYMSLISSQDSHDNMYQSLICRQVSPMKHFRASDAAETSTAENDYQQLDLTRINTPCDSTIYQELIPFHKD